MMIFKQLNNFFFDSDSISISDFLWFYCVNTVFLIVGLISIVLNLTF